MAMHSYDIVRVSIIFAFYVAKFVNNVHSETSTSEETVPTTILPFSTHYETSDLQYPESVSETLQCENATYFASQLLDDEREKTDRVFIKYIATLIKLGKYKLAQKEFQNLENPIDKVGRVVSEVLYNEKDLKKRNLMTKKILLFLSNLQTDSICELYLAAISELPKDIDIPPEILLISEPFVASNCSRINSAYYSIASAEEGTRALRIFTINLLEKWRDEIRQEDFVEIMKFCKTPRAFKSLKRFLPEIVRSAYNEGNKTHFDAVEAFAHDLCHNQLTVVALAALLGELKKENSGHNRKILELGFSLRKFGWNEGKRFDGNWETESLFGKLRRELPSDIGKMIWGSRCAIKNYVSGDYLYAANDNYTDTFMMAKKGDGEGRNVAIGGWWQFHPWKKDGMNETSVDLYWLIKNMEWERDKPYLCVRSVGGKGKKKGGKVASEGEVETCFKTGFKNKNKMMANWVLDPVISREGARVYQLYTLDKDARRFFLTLRKQPHNKTEGKDSQVDDEDDDTKIEMGTRPLAKVETCNGGSCYWQFECE